MGFMVEDVGCHILALGVADVGWIAHYDVELGGIGIGVHFLECVMVLEMDLQSESAGVVSGYTECFMGDVPCRDFGIGEPLCQCQGYAAASCSYVEDSEGCVSFQLLCLMGDPVDEFFCFGTWDEDSGGNMEGESAELGCAEHILHGFAVLQSEGEGFECLALFGCQIVGTSHQHVCTGQAEQMLEDEEGYGFGLAFAIDALEPLAEMSEEHHNVVFALNAMA